MKDYKQFKDPIYGYINISKKYMNGIIDTACFQRLRRIIQTSYSPLYSSAVHNRFVHSIGVFHLGEMAANQVVSEITRKGYPINNPDRIKEVFLMACLLHDVGHAPFSHTGEMFFLENGEDFSHIHKRLIKSVSSRRFSKEIPQKATDAAAPHEVVSAIVGLESFPNLFIDEDEKEFFARCITGYKYKEPSKEESIRNCFIQLLNSNVIDVDKLDYLIRDAYITGFDTINIDFERLLGAITIVDEESGYELGYYKNAISVLENVVYAHDAERKWIQSHPVVVYETYILQHILANLSSQIDKKNKRLFCIEALTEKGIKINGKLTISLMTDDDIIFLMKNMYSTKLSDEYFKRIERRHPVWKSEAEYKTFILGMTKGGIILDEFEKAMSATGNYLRGGLENWTINEQLVSSLNRELEELETSNIEEKTKKVQIENKQRILKIVNGLKKYADESGVEFDFVIIKSTQFLSGFIKPDFSDTNIVFQTGDQEKVAKVGDIVSSLQAIQPDRKEFYYLFYKRNNGKECDCQKIVNKLIQEFLSDN